MPFNKELLKKPLERTAPGTVSSFVDLISTAEYILVDDWLDEEEDLDDFAEYGLHETNNYGDIDE